MTVFKEDLRKWFGKGKKGDWVRVGTDGEIKGDCARDEGEGKPKCMPRSKAHSMSKDDRASSARRKRRADPEADRPGTGNKPIMVKTDKESKKVKKVDESSKKVPAGMKFMAGHEFKGTSHTYYRKGNKMSDPVMVHINGKEWKEFPTLAKAKSSALAHIKTMKEEVEQVDEAKMSTVDKKTLNKLIDDVMNFADPDFHDDDADKRLDMALDDIEKLAGKKVRNQVASGTSKKHWGRPNNNVGPGYDRLDFRRGSKGYNKKSSKTSRKWFRDTIRDSLGGHKKAMKGKLPESVEQVEEGVFKKFKKALVQKKKDAEFDKKNTAYKKRSNARIDRMTMVDIAMAKRAEKAKKRGDKSYVDPRNKPNYNKHMDREWDARKGRLNRGGMPRLPEEVEQVDESTSDNASAFNTVSNNSSSSSRRRRTKKASIWKSKSSASKKAPRTPNQNRPPSNAPKKATRKSTGNEGPGMKWWRHKDMTDQELEKAINKNRAAIDKHKNRTKKEEVEQFDEGEVVDRYKKKKEQERKGLTKKVSMKKVQKKKQEHGDREDLRHKKNELKWGKKRMDQLRKKQDRLHRQKHDKYRQYEEVEQVDEGLSHDRYMRSHGKKATGTGNWSFTTKRMGDPKPHEMHSHRGKLSDAHKEASKKLGTKNLYVMEEVEQVDEKNVPTNPSLWSKFKSQAKQKFDVYPSAYANGWAAKQYKKAGGEWKTVSEETLEEMFEVKYAKNKRGPIKVSKFKKLEDAKEFLATVKAGGMNGIISKGGKPVKEENNLMLKFSQFVSEGYGKKSMKEDEGCPCCGDGPCTCDDDCENCDCSSVKEGGCSSTKKEELSPAQKKHMDQDKDGDIDAEDMAKLRAKKKR